MSSSWKANFSLAVEPAGEGADPGLVEPDLERRLVVGGGFDLDLRSSATRSLATWSVKSRSVSVMLVPKRSLILAMISDSGISSGSCWRPVPPKMVTTSPPSTSSDAVALEGLLHGAGG